MEIVNETTTKTVNPDGTITFRVSAGIKRYRDDNAAWKDVVHGSRNKIAGNCEFVPISNGYRIWAPNGVPPYPSGWLPTDYWLEVVHAGATFTTRRATVLEASAPAPAQSWSDNLSYSVVGGVETWMDGDAVIFQRGPAWVDDGVTYSALRFA